MNEQQFTQLMGKFDDQDKRLASLEQKFAVEPPIEEPGTDSGTPSDEGKQDFAADITAAMKPFSDKLDALKTDFSAKVDDLTKRFEQVNPGTQAPENNAPAAPGADYL